MDGIFFPPKMTGKDDLTISAAAIWWQKQVF